MPSRVGAMPHPLDQKKQQDKSGGRQQGITMQDLKKQTAMRLMNQQHHTPGSQGQYCHQSPRGYSPSANQSVASLSPSTSKQRYEYSAYPHRSASRKNDRCSPKMHEPNDDASSHTSCSVRSHHGGYSSVAYSPRSQVGRPQKLPHGLTVHELKELTAARLAQEAAELLAERHSPPPAVVQQPLSQKNSSQARQQNSVKSRRSQRSTSSQRSSSVALPDTTAHSPTSFVADREMQSNNQHCVHGSISRFEFVPAEEIPLRSRHWSVDSVSTMGSEFFGSERSPFATPYRKAAGNGERPADNIFEIERSRSFPDPTDDLGRALESQSTRPRHHSHDVLTSPNPSFSERHELRSPYLNTPFWSVQEDKPSIQNDVHRNFDRIDQRGGTYPMSQDSSLSGFDDCRKFVSSLSLPTADDELPFVGQEKNRPLHPIPLHSQLSLTGDIPNWVAESVLVVTPQREARKIFSDEQTVRSDSAVGSSSIFRTTVDEQPSPSTPMWSKSNSSSNGNEVRPNSFSFGAFDSLADSLGATLNLGSSHSNQTNPPVQGVVLDSIFHRPLIESLKSSSEVLPFSEIENSSPNVMSELISRNSNTFWPKGFGWRKKDGYPE